MALGLNKEAQYVRLWGMGSLYCTLFLGQPATVNNARIFMGGGSKGQEACSILHGDSRETTAREEGKKP